jgi:signal transduction histidine kinase
MLIKHQFKNDGIRVDLDLPDDLPAVLFESSKLQLIFLSLFNNSRRALNEKYSGKNENKRIELKGEFEIRNGKRWLRILITDRGIGISPKNIPRLFDPIFTTKPIGEDGGMGLAISRQLLMENNGTISISSEQGNYTKVTVELPCNSVKHELYK